MKKLMFAVAAIAAGIAVADVTSANIVGYNVYESKALKQPSFGATFLPVGGAETYRLGSVTVADMSSDDDYLQVIDPSTLATTARYTYISPELAQAMHDDLVEEDPELAELVLTWVGWWDYFNVGEDGFRMDDEEIPNGMGFLALFKSGENLKFTFAGEAPTTTTFVETDAKKQPMICNYIPRQLKLSEITVENMSSDDDYLQVIDPATLATTARYTYISPELAQAMHDDLVEEDPELAELVLTWVGWWDYFNVGEDGYRMDDEPVPANAAFLGMFKSGENLIFNFPSSTVPVAE